MEREMYRRIQVTLIKYLFASLAILKYVFVFLNKLTIKLLATSQNKYTSEARQKIQGKRIFSDLFFPFYKKAYVYET